MAKHRSNGHASNGQAVAERLRAPAEGVRLSGRFYKPGQLLPKRYERARDPANNVPLAPPNFGRAVLPHSMTFVGKQSTIAHVYRNPDEAVLRSGGQAWKMRRDPSIMECLEARQRATALLGWHLEVEDEHDPKQKQLKEEMTKILKRTYQFTEYRRCLLEALWYGRYAVQHKFGFAKIDGKRRTVIQGWTPINGDKLVFRFDDGSGKHRDDEVGIRVTPISGRKDKIAGDRHLETTDIGMAYFLQPWERGLVAIHRHIIEDGDYEDPISAGRIHGVGIRDRIYWCWYQKQETMAQLMEVIDRTGSGITIYWYPAGNPQAEADTIELAEKQKHENVLVMPRQAGDPTQDAYGIERIEPNAGGIEMMSKIADQFFGNQIMRYINGGTLMSKSESLGIGGGGADFQERSFHQIVDYDSVKLEETITHETVEPLKRFNCPWAHDIPLFFKIDTDSVDAQEKLEAAKKLWDMGAKIKTTELMGKVGLSMPTDDDEFLQNPAMVPQQQPGIGGAPGMDGQMGDEAPEGSMQDLFGPLADGMGGNDPESPEGSGGEPPPNPFDQGGGPAQYAKKRDTLADDLWRAISETDTEPSELEKEAGNYKKGKLNWNGLTISIENPAGTNRHPDWKPLAHHYGYINRTEGRDGDHVDVFIGPDLDSDLVTVVDQRNAAGTFDEHKCLIGFNNAEDAAAAYLANYDEGWHLGPVTAMTVEQFKAWLADGDTTKPIEEQVSRYAKRQIRSTAGQQPLPGVADENTKQHHLWRAELHPKDAIGRWAEKGSGSAPPKQFGQKILFSEMAAKLHEAENHPDQKVGKAQQQKLLELAERSDLHPEQMAALLSGDEGRMRDLEKQAIATGQHEHSPQYEDPEMGTPMDLESRFKPGDFDPEIEAALKETRAGIRQGALNRAKGLREPQTDVRLVGRNIAPASETPSPSIPERSITPPEGIPGGSTQSDDGDGFSLSPQKQKIASGAVDTAPEISKGTQSAFFHGLNDAPGQEKLFDGLDLVGSEEPPPFDADKWESDRADRIKASKSAGNKHLDDVHPSVEAMRGKPIYNVHDPKERGIVRTVSNDGEVVVHWDDEHSASKNNAATKTEGKKQVAESWLSPSDLQDYVFDKSKVAKPRSKKAKE